MKKLSSTLYNKLVLQAEEAKERGLIELQDNILQSIGDESKEDVLEQYSFAELKKDINQDIWKLATKLMIFYDLKSVDALAVAQSVETLSAKALNELECSLGVENMVKGASEPDLPGESK